MALAAAATAAEWIVFSGALRLAFGGSIRIARVEFRRCNWIRERERVGGGGGRRSGAEQCSGGRPSGVGCRWCGRRLDAASTNLPMIIIGSSGTQIDLPAVDGRRSARARATRATRPSRARDKRAARAEFFGRAAYVAAAAPPLAHLRAPRARWLARSLARVAHLAARERMRAPPNDSARHAAPVSVSARLWRLWRCAGGD